MIKNISEKNITATPFTARKQWMLSNIFNDDLILVSTGEPVSHDYLDFSASSTALWTELWESSNLLNWEDLTQVFWGISNLNRDCNIAINYNTVDNPICQEGISGSGLFYPDTEPQNRDGTYKRLVYNQISKMFYNSYQNPTQLFGMDNIDFQLSNTNRIIGNQFVLFNISTDTMGDKLVPGSIIMYDLQFDDNAIITDDSNGNLIIRRNVFSKIQEVRNIPNLVLDGYASNGCTSV